MPEHALAFPGLGRIPRHGTHIATLRTGWFWPSIGSTTANKATRNEREEDEALFHAGKVAEPPVVASMGMSWSIDQTNTERRETTTTHLSAPTPSLDTKKTGGMTPPA